ncbi:MAG: hypothetical protein ACQEQF_09600 [Bacillota bacterium]
MNNKQIYLPNNLEDRNIYQKVIPTVCNLENMLEKLVEVDGDHSKLESWEKRSYKAYQIDEIKQDIIDTSPEKWADIIKEHIINGKPDEFGANCIDIYLVAYTVENYGGGRKKFVEHILKTDITDKENSAQAIWQVGRGDGEYLEVLNKDGTVKDWDFFASWTGQKVPENKKDSGDEEKNADEVLKSLKSTVENIKNENRKKIGEINKQLDDLKKKMEKQNLELQKQDEKITELLEEMHILEEKRKENSDMSLWDKLKNIVEKNK